MSSSQPEVFRWVLDTQNLWPTAKSTGTGPAATAAWAAESEAEKALGFLAPDERSKAIRFYHIRDAKLSIGSSLLKRCAIATACKVPWAEIIISRDKTNGKPYFKAAEPTLNHLEFNLSHHGSLVALVGSTDDRLRLGVDVVQVNLGKDVPAVREKGWKEWITTYEAVFSEREVRDMVSWSPPGPLTVEEIAKARLRHFYAHWCLKEAYVKMTGEALMAPWLKEMEFRNVHDPSPAESDGDWGETWENVEIWHSGTRIEDVRMALQARGNDYMIGTAASVQQSRLLPFQELDINRDVYPFAQTYEHTT